MRTGSLIAPFSPRTEGCDLVSQIVFLDSGPFGLVTNPRRSPQSVACAQWLQTFVVRDLRVIVPEIADYEVRRELLRAKKEKGLAHSRCPRQSAGVSADYHSSNAASGSVLGTGPAARPANRIRQGAGR